MGEVNATIAASAPQETLVDQPQVVKNVVRVSGPFTVEGVQPAEERMDLGGDESPIGGEPEDLATFAPPSGSPRSQAKNGMSAANAESFHDTILKALKRDGVNFLGNRTVAIERLDGYAGSTALHGDGEWRPSPDSDSRRLAVSIGPQYGPVTVKQVHEALRESSRRGFDDLIFAGFDFDGSAQAYIQEDTNPDVRTHLAHIRPDLLMDGLLKDSPSSQLFTVTGLPRVNLRRTEDDEYVVEMEGVDIYDPVSNAVIPTRASKVAAWFVDSDYDGRTFYVTQAFFPDAGAWDKLAKALGTLVEPERFAAFSSTVSLPFSAGEHKRVAVKVIDPRGQRGHAGVASGGSGILTSLAV